MLLAHAPAGYLLTRLLSRTLFKDIVDPKRSEKLYQMLMAAGIIGAVLPDFDFIYHVFIDSDRTPHHSYITHMPLFWLGMFFIAAAVGRIRRNPRFTAITTVGCLSALLHLVCDTATGVIYWLYPFSKKGFNVFSVSDVHIWWVHNFMYHWTFLLEIVIVAGAMIYFLRVKETVNGIVVLFRHSQALRAITLRISVCTFGLAVVLLVGSLRFDIDNRVVTKILQLGHQVVRMAFKS